MYIYVNAIQNVIHKILLSYICEPSYAWLRCSFKSEMLVSFQSSFPKMLKLTVHVRRDPMQLLHKVMTAYSLRRNIDVCPETIFSFAALAYLVGRVCHLCSHFLWYGRLQVSFAFRSRFMRVGQRQNKKVSRRLVTWSQATLEELVSVHRLRGPLPFVSSDAWRGRTQISWWRWSGWCRRRWCPWLTPCSSCNRGHILVEGGEKIVGQFWDIRHTLRRSGNSLPCCPSADPATERGHWVSPACHHTGRRQTQTSAQLTEHWAHNAERVGHLPHVGGKDRQKWEGGDAGPWLFFWTGNRMLTVSCGGGCVGRHSGIQRQVFCVRLCEQPQQVESTQEEEACGGLVPALSLLPLSAAVSSKDGRIWSQGLFLTCWLQTLCSLRLRSFIEANCHRSTLRFYRQTGQLLGLLRLEATCSNHRANRWLISKQAYSETKQDVPITLCLFCFFLIGETFISHASKEHVFQVMDWSSGKLESIDEGWGEWVPHLKQMMKPAALRLFCPTSTLDWRDQTCDTIIPKRPNQRFSPHIHVLFNAFSNTR